MPYLIATTVRSTMGPNYSVQAPSLPVMPGEVFTSYAPAEIGYGPAWSYSQSSRYGQGGGGGQVTGEPGPQGTGSEGGAGGAFEEWTGEEDQVQVQPQGNGLVGLVLLIAVLALLK